MVAALTTDDLLNEIKDQVQLPSTEGRLTDAQILKLASEVLRTECAALLVSTRQQRLVTAASDVSIVSGTYLYALPERALAAGVTDVLIVDGDDEYSAPEISIADAWRYRQSHGGWDSPYAYCWRDDDIELLPHPEESSYSLRVLYPRGLMRLVTVASCARVSSKTGTTITTAASVPSTWASSETLDIVRGSPNGQPRGIDLAGTSISGTSITISAGVPSTVVAGDYVCLDGETCIPPVPDAVWPVLVSASAREVSVALGDGPLELQTAERRADRQFAAARTLLTPRSRGASQKIIARGYGSRRGWR